MHQEMDIDKPVKQNFQIVKQSMDYYISGHEGKSQGVHHGVCVSKHFESQY